VDREKPQDAVESAASLEATADVDMPEEFPDLDKAPAGSRAGDAAGAWTEVKAKKKTQPDFINIIYKDPNVPSDKLREFGNEIYRNLCQNLYNNLWNDFVKSNADCPSHFKFDLKLFSESDLGFMIPAYIEYDKFENRSYKTPAEKARLQKDDGMIRAFTAAIQKSDSITGMGSQQWQEFSENGQKRALPFFLLFKSKMRYQERRLFINFAQEAHASKQSNIPKAKLDTFSPKLRKTLIEEHQPLLENLKLWKPVDKTKRQLDARAAPVTPATQNQFSSKPKSGSYASVARPDPPKEDKFTLFIHSGQSKQGLPEDLFNTLRRALIQNNTRLAMDPSFDKDCIQFTRFVWKPSVGILSCSSAKSQEWFKEKLSDTSYTGGVECRGWAPGEHSEISVHFQVPHEFDMGEFGVVDVLKAMNPRFKDIQMTTFDVKPARDGNSELFIRSDEQLKIELLKSNKAQMPWGSCTILPGKPAQNHPTTKDANPDTPETSPDQDLTVQEEAQMDVTSDSLSDRLSEAESLLSSASTDTESPSTPLQAEAAKALERAAALVHTMREEALFRKPQTPTSAPATLKPTSSDEHEPMVMGEELQEKGQ
jgi:hypothetical protein